MGRIQSSVGLISGIPIQDTVDKLMALESKPRDTLVDRNKVLGAEQAAYTDLTALVLGVQFAVRKLSSASLFAQRTATSSDPMLLTATASSSAAPGNYSFVPAQLAQTQSAISSGVAATDQALGGGSLSFRFGGFVNAGLNLADLNNGAGVAHGKIRITDRSGTSQVIDLRFAQTVDDVLTAINTADNTQVTASVQGDRLVLHDSSGGSGSLSVQEVSGGRTAADLGLAGISVAANDATGQDIVKLFDGIALSELRDGNGLSLRSGLPDLTVNFRDGSSLDVDLDPSATDAPKTLGAVLDRLNAADQARLSASISADGKHIQLTDLTSGGGSFSVGSPLGGSLAEELGLTNPAAGGTITSSRLISGLKTTLVGSLAGGRGPGTLGVVNLTDRSGAAASVNLAGAETLDDVLAAINGAGLGIKASYNAARNGLTLSDTTGAAASNLIVADGDATGTATKLGLTANAAATTINSGSLDRQVVNRSTLLDTYQAGKPVGTGSFLITDSAGNNGAVNLSVLKPKTIGDIIDAINALSVGVEARINDAGDGIALVDTAGGTGRLTVGDAGSGHAAADLRLAGTAKDATINGQPAQVIDGTTTVTITLDADETLDDLVTKINDAAGGAAANIITESSGSLRNHLSLASTLTGKAGELLIDGSGLGLSFSDLTAAQDAILQVGSGAAATLLSGSSNTISGAAPGIDVVLKGASTDTVTVSVAESVDGIAAALQTFVDNYNKLHDKLDTYTAFDATAGTKGTLFGSPETLRIESDLSRLITGQQSFSGPVRSLAELGISINDQGDLSFDKSKLQSRFAADSKAVTDFFSDEETGFAPKADAMLERLVGKDNSTLVNRVGTLQKQIDSNAQRIDVWNTRLDSRRDRLMDQFTRLEDVLARIQNNMTAIQQISYIGPIQSSSK